MDDAGNIFTDRIDFDPDQPIEVLLEQVPARWVVYLFRGQEGEPIQLLSVKNLRASLKRRLGGMLVDEGPNRRVDYTRIVRQIKWRRVDSPLECDLVYLEAARRTFPQSYKGMTGFRQAWFIHIDPDAKFPRYVRTTGLDERAGLLFGPLEDKHSAGRLVQLLEDAFDLCRYYPVLLETPKGKACAYKEMGRCPAPCDGSISLQQYCRMIDWSVQVLRDPREELRQQTVRMQQAAAALKFEIAQRIKQHVDQLSMLGKASFRHVKELHHFAYVSIQHGAKAGHAKIFAITPGRIEHLASLVAEPRGTELFRFLLEYFEGGSRLAPVEQAAAERIAVVSHHLFSPKTRPGSFIHLHDLTAESLARAYRELQKQSAESESPADEGVLRELQQM